MEVLHPVKHHSTSCDIAKEKDAENAKEYIECFTFLNEEDTGGEKHIWNPADKVLDVIVRGPPNNSDKPETKEGEEIASREYVIYAGEEAEAECNNPCGNPELGLYATSNTTGNIIHFFFQA